MKRLIGTLTAILLTTGCSDDTCADSSCGIGGESAGGGIPTAGMTSAGGEAPIGGAGGAGGQAEGGFGGAGGAPPTMTTVSVVDLSGDAGIGLNVIANNADGSLADNGVTGADGTVELVVPNAGSVSLLYSVTYDEFGMQNTYRYIDTVHLGDSAPDTLRFNVYFPGPPFEPTETMNHFLLWPVVPGATSYSISSNCWSGTTDQASYAVLDGPGCTTDGLYDILLVARDAADVALEHAHVEDQAFAAGTTGQHIFSWSNQPIQLVDVGITNIPSGAPDGYLSSGSQRSHPGGYAIGFGGSEQFTQPGSSISRTFQHLSNYGTEHCQEAVINTAAQLGIFSSIYRQRCNAAADLSPLLVDATRLSRFESLETITDPLTIAWEEAFANELGDVLVASQYWEHDSLQTRWTNYIEPATGQAVFPDLPGFLSEYGYDPSDELNGIELFHIDYIPVQGFDAIVALEGMPNNSTRDTERYYTARSQ